MFVINFRDRIYIILNVTRKRDLYSRENDEANRFEFYEVPNGFRNRDIEGRVYDLNYAAYLYIIYILVFLARSAENPHLGGRSVSI